MNPVSIICAILAVAFIIIGLVQFSEKGFLLNNYYIWASKKQRQAMSASDKQRDAAPIKRQ